MNEKYESRFPKKKKKKDSCSFFSWPRVNEGDDKTFRSQMMNEEMDGN